MAEVSIESAAKFARRLGYRARDDDLELTIRAVVIGSVFAVINGVVNMFFAFRYAGGLAQYWVILVAYPLCKATELLPRGSLLNPGPFSPKEHVIVMTMAIAGSLAGTLARGWGRARARPLRQARRVQRKILTKARAGER